MALGDFNLPDIKESDLDSQKERRQILEYLYQLTEQLRYVLMNLDEDNLSDSLKETIDGAYRASETIMHRLEDVYGNVSSVKQTSSELSARVEDAEGNMSALSQKVDGFTLVVTNGEQSSVIQLKSGSATIASQTIRFTGDVIFASDLTDGNTVISGSNIQTGTIDASDVSVTNLNASNIVSGIINGIQMTGVYGSFDYLSAAGGAVYLGRDYIDVNGVQIGYLSGYGDVNVLPYYHEYGNLGVGRLAWDQCVARYLYSSSGGVSSYSMRELKDNIRPYAGDVIDHLEPVRFVMKSDPEQKEQIGFIADDVMKVLPEVVREFQDRSMDKPILTMDYSRLVVPLVDELKRLKMRVATTEKHTADLEARIAALEAKEA